MNTTFFQPHTNWYIQLFYWLCWFGTVALMTYSRIKLKPYIYRIVLQILMIRNIVPIYEFHVRRDANKKDPALNQMFLLWQMGIVIMYLTFTCVIERWWISVPQTIIYLFIVCFGTTIQFYNDIYKSDKNLLEKLTYVKENKLHYVFIQVLVVVFFIVLAGMLFNSVIGTVIHFSN